MTQPISILIADDHKVFAEGLVAVLQIKLSKAAFTIVHSGEAAWEKLQMGSAFELLITDISMTGMTGLELATRVKRNYPSTKVLILSMHNEKRIVSAAFETEAEGFVLKTSTAQEIANAINDILNDTTHYSREVLQIMLTQAKTEKQTKVLDALTERELEILRLIVDEKTNEQVADLLFISKRTVESHRKNIMEKTECQNVIALYKFAARNYLIDFKNP